MDSVKRIALVAHDNCKKDMVEWVDWNRDTLLNHHLICTGTTGKLVNDALRKIAGAKHRDEIRILKLKLGPFGGDQQLGAMIAEGGIDSPAGADYPSSPIEVPPLRSQMKGKLNMMVGLANDELGYIIPKSQWDKKPPYAYGRTKAPQYGEENSPGPDVAPTIHREALALLKQFQAALTAAETGNRDTPSRSHSADLSMNSPGWSLPARIDSLSSP